MTSHHPIRLVRVRRAFTLIELLVTMGIMAILMALVIPAFRGFSQSANVSGSVARVRTNIGLARQWAITQRTQVQVVFAVSNSVSAVPAEGWRAYRSMAVFVPTNTAGMGYYIKEWEALPQGIVFTPTTAAFPGSGHGASVIIAGRQFTNQFPATSSSNRVPTRGILFNPDGSITQASEIYVMPGSVETNGMVIVRTNGPKFGVEVQLLTGQVRVRDYNP